MCHIEHKALIVTIRIRLLIIVSAIAVLAARPSMVLGGNSSPSLTVLDCDFLAALGDSLRHTQRLCVHQTALMVITMMSTHMVFNWQFLCNAVVVHTCVSCMQVVCAPCSRHCTSRSSQNLHYLLDVGNVHWLQCHGCFVKKLLELKTQHAKQV
jgi:hypothetical protein